MYRTAPNLSVVDEFAILDDRHLTIAACSRTIKWGLSENTMLLQLAICLLCLVGIIDEGS